MNSSPVGKDCSELEWLSWGYQEVIHSFQNFNGKVSEGFSL